MQVRFPLCGAYCVPVRSNARPQNRMPPRLYKYESFSTRSLENLKAQSLYFGPPSGFNDPYDCSFLPNIRQPSDAEVEDIRSVYLQNQTTPQNARKVFETTPCEGLRQVLLRSAHHTCGQGSWAFAAEDYALRSNAKANQSLHWACAKIRTNP